MMIARYAGRHLGWTDGAQRARALLGAAYTTNTKRVYMAAWERFRFFCSERHLRALPAHYTTLAAYVGWLHLRGTVAHASLGTYLAPIDTVHELAGFALPSAHPVFSRLRKGYLRLRAAAAGGMQRAVGALPAEIIFRGLRLAGAGATPEQRRVCAGLVLAFLMFNRPGAASAMRAADLHFTSAGLRVQQAFHKSEARTRARSAFLVPVHPLGYSHDTPLTFLRAYRRAFLAAGGQPFDPLFAAPGLTPGPRVTSAWLHALLSWLRATPPLGVPWTGKSIRSGAATAANAVGVPLPVVAAYMEHSESAVTARHYIDARSLPTSAAWEFFGRYISDWTGSPRPVRRGGYA